MSIKYGLQEETTEISAPANVFLISRNTAKLDAGMSTTYKYHSAYYSHSRKYNKGISYPSTFNKNILNLKQYTYTLYVYDAKTEELIDPNTLNYEILTIVNDHNRTIIKTTEYFQITLREYSFFSLTIKISGNNYLNTYVMAKTDFSTEHYIQNTKIVNINNVPDGVSIVNTVVQQDSNGTVSENILDFPSSPTKLETATITIPKNTKFYDKNNNLLSGPINMKIAHFSPTTAFGLFSSGWDLPNIEINGMPVQDIGFVSGGFYSIEIYDNNNVLASRME